MTSSTAAGTLAHAGHHEQRPVRTTGVVACAGGLAPDSHLCWSYRDRADFLSQGLEFMNDGIAAGMWIEYVADAGVRAMRKELESVAGPGSIRGALDAGGIGFSSVSDFYRFRRDADVVDPAASIAALIAAGRAALDAGYTGFRAVVDATTVARSAEQRESFAQFEHLLDRQMCTLPLSAMCAYDVDELGHAAVSELACLHPIVGPLPAAFRLYSDLAVELAVVGDIDLASDALFDTTLERVLALSSDMELTIDATGLEFIDHRGLLAVERRSAELHRSVVWRTRSSTLAHVVEVLGLRALRVELVPA